MDFTIKTYKSLLKTLQQQGFDFQSFQEFLTSPLPKTIVLRHDVDKLPENSLLFAQIQHDLGIKGSYYFRIVPESFSPGIIEEIAKLGHEIGYHYEDVDLASQSIKTKEEKERIIPEEAIKLFEKHLTELRKFYPVKTICMHGSPRSEFDNKLLWKYYNYHDYGIIGEPYFDINFDKVFYLTDTGRLWDGWKSSLRDKVPQQEKWIKQGLVFHSTKDIINAFNNEIRKHAFTERSRSEMPHQIMFTFHPQRWTDNTILWTKELVLQNVKNVVKYFLNRFRNIKASTAPNP